MTGVVLIALAGLITFSSFTPAADSGRAKLVLDIRTYLDKNVQPIMKPQRVQLDRLLTAEERAQVAALNNRVRQLVAARHQSGAGFLSQQDFSIEDPPTFTDAQKRRQKSDRDEMRRIMAQAWAIADRHEQEINRLLGEKSTFFDTWERGITAIVTDYLDNRFYFIGRKQIIERVKNREIVQYYLPVAFLLWDPQHRIITDDLIK
jgi:hypothetical protein